MDGACTKMSVLCARVRGWVDGEVVTAHGVLEAAARSESTKAAELDSMGMMMAFETLEGG
jgi:hypothetical protein